MSGYETFDELIDAEANGWVAVVILAGDGQTKREDPWPWVVGPFATKRQAENARVRLRNRWKKQKADPWNPEVDGMTASFFVRPAWKDTK